MTETEQLIISTVTKISGHVEIINDEMGELAQRMAIVETQIESILWVERAVAGVIIVAVVGAVLSLVIRRKNHK